MTQEPDIEKPEEGGPPPAKLPKERQKKTKKSRSYGVVDSGKARHAAKLHLLVWPEGGGNPYPLDVEPDDEGWFYLDKKRQRGPYYVRPGTVFHEEGKYRAWLKVGHYETLDPRDLGKGPHPKVVNGVNDAAIISEIAGLHKKGMSGWQKAGIASISLLLLGLIAVLVWGVISIGGDISGLGEDLARAVQSSSSGGTAPPGSDVGHQPISPGGRQ